MSLTVTPHISVVVPVYGCKTTLWELYFQLTDVLNGIADNYEIILVNDASPDGAWEVISEICTKDKKVKGINLSRNFGQHYAITAGVDCSEGEWLVVMDCDLQDKPGEIMKLYKHATENNFDLVFARRDIRFDSFLKKLSSKLFYKILNYFTDKDFNASIANFSIANTRVISSFKLLREQNRAYPLFLKWLGFNYSSVPVEHSARKEGRSSYSIKKLFNLAFDIIISNSNKPLKLIVSFGFFISAVSFLVTLILLVQHAFGYITVTGWTGIMVSLWFIFGILMVVLGTIGLYVGKIFNEVKSRPLYVVKNILNK